MVAPLGSTLLGSHLYQPHENTGKVEEIYMLLFYLPAAVSLGAGIHVSHSLDYPLPSQAWRGENAQVLLPLRLPKA